MHLVPKESAMLDVGASECACACGEVCVGGGCRKTQSICMRVIGVCICMYVCFSVGVYRCVCVCEVNGEVIVCMMYWDEVTINPKTRDTPHTLYLTLSTLLNSTNVLQILLIHTHTQLYHLGYLPFTSISHCRQEPHPCS